ncbi:MULTISPECIES: glucosaminidase domain-containing protein [Tenacibaculum]|uniref:glucosaminidase domain-containing protein n=1 Tax=Tenacibaculum TaxID=104267 RepID=UPI001F0B489C|nr:MULTISPECIES: glucosaminidase domain-containing protein [Tenacibaculum]MCH3880752.1 glucosaminidase domain-containing protein [Tenacibaculum aquimarinum]MDO6599649.1 glucosaminidase domain-containing protein [Tenacibaculum sp. 1_MG-2023]
MRLKYFIIIVLSTLAFSSCGSKKKVVQPTKPVVVIVEETPEEQPNVNQEEHVEEIVKANPNLNRYTLQYINKFAPIAVSEMHAHKVPASITLAQGILESGNGRSDLATRSNNHFGIKCHRGWQGQKVLHDDDEKGECFRKYQHPDTSFKDHSLFLAGRKRYASLFTLDPKDYKRWAKGLRKAGYATDRKYPSKLISIIERYKLYEFDYAKSQQNNTVVEETTEIVKEEPNIVIENTVGNYYQVVKGDTLYSISRKYNTTVEKLKEINGLTSNEISIGQHLLLN